MHKFIYILILSCSFIFNAKAQKNNTVNVDSILESIKSKYDQVEETGGEPSVDSSLTSNQFTIPADSVENWKNLPVFAYAKYLDSLLKVKQATEKVKMPKSNPKSSSSSSSSSTTPEAAETERSTWLDALFTSPITMIVLWVLAALFVGFILYKLFFTDGNPFKARTKTSQQAAPEVADEHLTSESDFDALINQSVRKGNFRLAIRYQYLKSLHRLADKNFIEMTVDKTNYQYVRELGSRGPAVNQQFQNDFASLTLNYEYVWYGEFAVDDMIYNRIAKGFTEFNQKI